MYVRRQQHQPGASATPDSVPLSTESSTTGIFARSHAIASEALALRTWALNLFATRGSSRPTAHPPTAAVAWEVFLRTERCALPLRARLALSDTPLPVGLARVLEARETAEIQRALSGRAQLLEIGRLACARGFEPIVLKGGVVALRGDAPLDLADADVLVRSREEADLLSGALDQEGYGSTGGASVAHVAGRFLPETVPVEIHFAIKEIAEGSHLHSRAQPLHGFPGLWRLSPADHLWHLLVHSAVTHPYRRGCLRDVLLIRNAVQECSATALDEVRHRVARHPASDPMGALLGLAQAVERGGAIADCFRVEAVANYLLRTRFRWLARSPALEPMSATLFTLLGSHVDRRVEWADVLGKPPLPSRWGFLAGMERRWPWLGGTGRRALRTLRLALARLLLWPLAATAKRIARSPQGPLPLDPTAAP